jgi:TonB family protein
MLALIMLGICPVITLGQLLNTVPANVGETPDVTATFLAAPGAAVVGIRDSVLEMVLPWMVLIWSFGVIFLSLRAWKQWRRVKVLVLMAQALPQWQGVVDAMAEKFRLRRGVRVLCSKAIATPVVVGWLRPMILLPVAVACNFPAPQVELIFAHELAHLRRWDPVANVFQIILETLHFYHPVVHWISRDVRNEREICCDAMALAVSGGSRRDFVEALADLGELSERHGSLLLAANGGVLLDRVEQLVTPFDEDSTRRASARFVALLVAGVLLAVTLQLQWSQARFRKNLTESIGQLGVILTSRLQPLTPSIQTVRWNDLVPSSVTVARPIRSESDPGVLTGADPFPAESKREITLQGISAASLKIADLSDSIERPRLLFGNSQELEHPQSSPVAIQMRQPIYPQAALIRGIEGRVIIEFGIAADGSVQDIHIVSSAPAGVFDQSALQAMRGWKYATDSFALPKKRYRQTMAFTLHVPRNAGVTSMRSGSEQVEAQVGCEVPLGSLICRSPGK